MIDLVVIGGGINGAGIARDAAMRGLKVHLIEKNDWAFGTSSRSSMLAHGGVRYLEQFEFGLVHEALQDREIMFRQAPHLVKPLRFYYPIYPDVANKRTVRIGLFLYDLLSHGKSVQGRKYHRKRDFLARFPGVSGEKLKGAASYTDGQLQSVERFVTELIWDAKQHGAICWNHAKVTRICTKDGKVTGVEVEKDGENHTIACANVVNATGAWTDKVLHEVSPGKKVRTTKGIHLFLPKFINEALIVKARDGRTFFFIPWQDYTMVGTTDTEENGDPALIRADAEDVAYLVKAGRRFFPEAPWDNILFTYAGVRPLVNEQGLTESSITRRHVIFDHEEKEGLEGLWTLQGGKITTYRSLAEGILDTISKRRDWKISHPTKKGTMPGGPLVPWGEYRSKAIESAKLLGVSPACVERFIDMYGARWQQVAAAGRTERIRPKHPYMWCEVDYAVNEEDAQTLSDLVYRRTKMGWSTELHRVFPSLAKHMAELLGKDEKWEKAQVTAAEEDWKLYAIP
jgi:glycerol-3-phosphate dehydrogenase